MKPESDFNPENVIRTTLSFTTKVVFYITLAALIGLQLHVALIGVIVLLLLYSLGMTFQSNLKTEREEKANQEKLSL